MASQPLTPSQLPLPLSIQKEIEIDGVGMGVLSDGTPYLTGRGLARFCGVDPSVIQDIGAGWSLTKLRPRESKIKETLRQQGLSPDSPYMRIAVSGSTHFAYPDAVCMAVLEYYAFDSGAANETAIRNYRILARRSFRDFIYTQVGYSPMEAVPSSWQQFHDRVSLTYHRVPAGYFSIFKELSDVIVTLIRGGAKIGDQFVPDISVGIHGGKHWTEGGLDNAYGPRIRHDHFYPDYFSQAMSNPQPVYCYPDEALGEFRRWMRTVYLPEKLPAYLGQKAKQGALPPSFSEMALRMLTGKEPPKVLK